MNSEQKRIRHSLFLHCPSPRFFVPFSLAFSFRYPAIFFPFRFVNSLVISSSIFGRVIFYRHASDPVIGCPWTSRSLCVDHAAETVLTREKCTVIHLVISFNTIYTPSVSFFGLFGVFFGVLVIVKSGQKYTNTWAGATAKWSER